MLLKTARHHYELFDSLGSSDDFAREHIPYKGICEVNNIGVQKESSSSCGEFCLYFIIHRLHNLDMLFEHFINDFFSDNVDINEKQVEEYFKTINDE